MLNKKSRAMLEHSDNVTGFGNHSVTDRQLWMSPTGNRLCHRPAQQNVAAEHRYTVTDRQR